MNDAFSKYSEEPQSSTTAKPPITEDGSPEGEGDSIHIPAEFLQGTKFKPGDELVLKVVSADDEGVEVEYATAEGKGEEGGESGGMSANEEIDQMGEME